MDTEEELIDWWKKTMTSEFVDEFVFYDISGEMDGEWEEITPIDPRHDEKYDGHAQIHDSETTSLRIKDNTYWVEDH
jgi:hypothetical protein